MLRWIARLAFVTLRPGAVRILRLHHFAEAVVNRFTHAVRFRGFALGGNLPERHQKAQRALRVVVVESGGVVRPRDHWLIAVSPSLSRVGIELDQIAPTAAFQLTAHQRQRGGLRGVEELFVACGCVSAQKHEPDGRCARRLHPNLRRSGDGFTASRGQILRIEPQIAALGGDGLQESGGFSQGVTGLFRRGRVSAGAKCDNKGQSRSEPKDTFHQRLRIRSRAAWRAELSDVREVGFNPGLHASSQTNHSGREFNPLPALQPLNKRSKVSVTRMPTNVPMT